ncbi:hypothetical protein [Spirosoma sp. KNUC1025]|uniref:hypothetical protein n=1 Tax=Spirosoma sp. KNUC1025 TaxID=2894082 RepID=UPI00386BB57B|nr:hypothetical protein LN737_17170 [Spirosoma sp. KNUC1025]
MRSKSYNSPTYWQSFTKTDETSQWVAGLDEQLKHATHRAKFPLQPEKGHLTICLTDTSFWLIYSFEREGCLAIRTCFDPQSIKSYKVGRSSENKVEYQVEGALGQYTVTIELPKKKSSLLRYTTTLVARQPFTIQAFPRDVYVLDKGFKPAATEGMVYVTQSGPTAGLIYLSVTKPLAGSLLYFQNLTALNDFCQATQTDPSGSVSVKWPEIGFALPTTQEPLPAGKELTLSDAFLFLVT